MNNIDSVILDLKAKTEKLENDLISQKPVIQTPVITTISEPRIEEKVLRPKTPHRKKNYQKLTQMMIDDTLLKYPTIPEEYRKDMYTTNGDDLYVDFKGKKFEIKKYFKC